MSPAQILKIAFEEEFRPLAKEDDLPSPGKEIFSDHPLPSTGDDCNKQGGTPKILFACNYRRISKMANPARSEVS